MYYWMYYICIIYDVLSIGCIIHEVLPMGCIFYVPHTYVPCVQVSGTLAVDPDWAEHLLISWRWNVDALVQSYTDDPEAAVLAAGLRTRNPDPAPSPASSCPVCLSPRPADSPAPPTLSCLHYCCLVRRIAMETGVYCSTYWVV